MLNLGILLLPLRSFASRKRVVPLTSCWWTYPPYIWHNWEHNKFSVKTWWLRDWCLCCVVMLPVLGLVFPMIQEESTSNLVRARREWWGPDCWGASTLTFWIVSFLNFYFFFFIVFTLHLLFIFIAITFHFLSWISLTIEVAPKCMTILPAPSFQKPPGQ